MSNDCQEAEEVDEDTEGDDDDRRGAEGVRAAFP